jgi:hypothetical protein
MRLLLILIVGIVFLTSCSKPIVVKADPDVAHLDEEYFEIITKDSKNETRLQEISNEREENAKIVGRLLEKLEI